MWLQDIAQNYTRLNSSVSLTCSDACKKIYSSRSSSATRSCILKTSNSRLGMTSKKKNGQDWVALMSKPIALF